MEYRSLQVTLICASDLPNVRHIGRMKVYAKISISENSGSERTCVADKSKYTNPYWNCKVQYAIPEEAVQQEGDNLVIKLYDQRSLKEDIYVGELKLSLKQLFDGALARQYIDYPVARNDSPGRTFGTLKLSYSFGSTHINVENFGTTQSIHVQKESNTSTVGPGPWKGFFVMGVIADGLQIGTALSDGAKYLYENFFGEEEEE